MLFGVIAGANYALRKDADSSNGAAGKDIIAQIASATDNCQREEYALALRTLDPIRSELFAKGNIDGLKVYAKCRAAVPAEQNSHMILATASLIRIAKLAPYDADVRVQLFDLYCALRDYDTATQHGDQAVAKTNRRTSGG